MHSLSSCQPDLRQHIINHIVEDEVYVHIKDKLEQQNVQRKYKGYQLEGDELLTYKNRIYIPNVVDLRRTVMDEIHQAPYSRHPRYQRTIAIAGKQYFCPGKKKEIAKYISMCIKCQ